MSTMYCSIRVAALSRLLDLQGDQVRLGLAPGEVDADRAAGDQHAADQRDDQQRVLRERVASAASPRGAEGDREPGRAGLDAGGRPVGDLAGPPARQFVRPVSRGAPQQPAVEPSRPAAAMSARPAAAAARAQRLPSSTPHWSKLSMPQTAPDVKTRCS